MKFLDLGVQIIAFLAIFAPLVVNQFSKKRRLLRSSFLIDLINTRDSLTRLIEVESGKDSESKVIKRLEKLLEEINEDIGFESKHSKNFSYNFYPLILAVEVFVGFNFIYLKLMKKIAKSTVEGVLRKGSVQIIIWGGLFSMAFMITIFVEKHLFKKTHSSKSDNSQNTLYKNYWVQNIFSLVFFNIVLGFLVVGFGLIVKKLDPSVSIW